MARIIEHDDPEYEAEFARGWGAGMSITSRQAACLVRSTKGADPDRQESQPEQDSSRSLVGSQEDHLLANQESKED